jgi:alpha-glucosidase
MAVPVSVSSQSDWWKTGVVYQIYPRSFADSNGDGIGDLAGVIQHLDHINDGTPNSLGVDAIWLSPIYPSPDFDFGYDVADYLNCDPRFGTLSDFDRLVAAAHDRGVKVILDLVLNHSSHQHPWFVASRSSRTGPYADWYIWRDSPGRSVLGGRRPPNNWGSYFGGSAWTWDEGRGQFYLHTFLPQQPDLNWRNPDVRRALQDVVRTWLDRGVDGFRLDVFNTFFKDAALRSNPLRVGRRRAWTWQRHLHDRNQNELADALAELRAIVDEKPGRMTVGELFDGSVHEAAQHSEPRHLIFDWSLIGLPWSAAAFSQAIAARDAVFGPDRWPANVMSNHDQPRHAGRYAGAENGQHRSRDPKTLVGDARAKVAATLLLTLRGTPFLYYGEEIALRNIPVPKSEAVDPPARRANFLFPWWNRDQSRAPMQWSSGPNGGFTTGRPWLRMAPDLAVRNVEAQASDPGSVLSLYRRLIALRRSSPALLEGAQQLAETGSDDVLAFLRTFAGGAASPGGGPPDQRAFVALNFGSRPAKIRIPPALDGRPWLVALSTHTRGEGSDPGTEATLEPFEAIVVLDR